MNGEHVARLCRLLGDSSAAPAWGKKSSHIAYIVERLKEQHLAEELEKQELVNSVKSLLTKSKKLSDTESEQLKTLLDKL